MKITTERGHAMATAPTAATSATAMAAKFATGTSKRNHTNRYGRKITTQVSSLWFSSATSATTTLVCLLVVSMSVSSSITGSATSMSRISPVVQQQRSLQPSIGGRLDLGRDEAIVRASLDSAINNHIGDYASYIYIDGGEIGDGNGEGEASIDNLRAQQQQQQQPVYYISPSASIRATRQDTAPLERAIESMGCKNLIAYCSRELSPQSSQWSRPAQFSAAPRASKEKLPSSMEQAQSSTRLDSLALGSLLELINDSEQPTQPNGERTKKATPKHTPRFGR